MIKKYPFEKLEVGDSFLVECEKRDSIRIQLRCVSMIRQYRLSSGSDSRFVTRAVKTGIRVWRVAKGYSPKKSEYIVEKGIPIPEGDDRPISRYAKKVSGMEIGERRRMKVGDSRKESIRTSLIEELMKIVGGSIKGKYKTTASDNYVTIIRIG